MGVVAATALLSALTAGCGVVVCRRGRGRGHQPGHAPAPHWSTHVTVTPTVCIYLVFTYLSIVLRSTAIIYKNYIGYQSSITNYLLLIIMKRLNFVKV